MFCCLQRQRVAAKKEEGSGAEEESATSPPKETSSSVSFSVTASSSVDETEHSSDSIALDSSASKIDFSASKVEAGSPPVSKQLDSSGSKIEGLSSSAKVQKALPSPSRPGLSKSATASSPLLSRAGRGTPLKPALALNSPGRDRKSVSPATEESVNAFLEESSASAVPAATTTSTTLPPVSLGRSGTLTGVSEKPAIVSTGGTSSSSSAIGGDDARGYNLQKILPLPPGFCDRFAAPDSDANILFLAQSGPEEEKQVKGGTLSKLVERLTLPDHGDPTFVRTFLLTYRSFTSPMELLQLMINRFYTPISDENDMDLRRTVQKPIRLRLFAVLKVWITSYSYDFEDDHDLAVRFERFCKEEVAAVMPSGSRQLLVLLEKALSREEMSK